MRWSSILAAGLVVVVASGTAANPATDRNRAPTKLPWAAAGLTERQAAAHLLDRFAFGSRPGDIDRVLEQGLEAWLAAQLASTVDDARLAQRVSSLDAWGMSTKEIASAFPPRPVLRREAMRAGMIDRPMDTGDPADPGDASDPDQQSDRRRAIREVYEKEGYRSQRELLGQLVSHKVIQAAHSERQLEAVLVDFWFNHFNVSLTDNQARGFLLSFERDAIAPGVLGRFEDLLGAVAAHPAMLVYLDNAQSTANPGVTTTIERRLQSAGMDRRRGMGMDRRRGPGMDRRPGAGMDDTDMQRRPPRARGLNENFGRELLELHTLGVDGGYTQEDVIAVARAFTGWTVIPPGEMGERARERMGRAGGGRMDRGGQGAARLGFIERDGFLFRPDAHDAKPKVVLGKTLPGGRGIEDGREVLELLAHHPSTARHLASKIAARFVADEPPPALVDRLAQTFLATGGDLREVMRVLAYSPEFWSSEARGRKIKSPFELAISAVRAVGAEVSVPPRAASMGTEMRRPAGMGAPGLAEWIGRMGQPLYAYQAPSGYPDRAEAWVSTGSLLTRMNFGLNLATGRVAGVELDLAALAGHREPESLEQALARYAALLLPERDLSETVRRLEPMVRDPELGGRVERAAAEVDDAKIADAGGREAPPRGKPEPIQHVVGVILGSPEFQRR